MAQLDLSPPSRLNLRLGRALGFSDDELFDLCARNRDLRIERTAEGDLIVMTPAGGASDRRNVVVVAALEAWSRRDGNGVAFGPSAGFILPDGAMYGPDAAWILRSRLDALTAEEREKFLPLCPDFVVELRSPSDRLADLHIKMEEYRDNGARLGWLIDPLERRVVVFRPQRPVEVLEDAKEVSGDPELPGLTLDLTSVWAGI